MGSADAGGDDNNNSEAHSVGDIDDDNGDNKGNI